MRFHYQALQRDGKLISGLIEAVSERGAHRDLLRRGIQPTVINPAAGSSEAAGRGRRLTRRDYATALKQLHTLVAGGVPIAETVTALAEAADHPMLARAYGELTARLRRGEAFPAAFVQCFPAIPQHIHRLIEAGDLSSRLGEALADAAEELEHEAKVRTELRQTLVYPAFLVVFGLSAVLFIFLVVVPRFAVMFEGKFEKLPLLSYLVIGAGMWFHDNLILVLALLAGIAAAAAYGLTRPQVREILIDYVTRLPLVRHWAADVDVARWAGVLARLLENRVLLIQSLELARIERDVRAGAALATALGDSAFLAPTALTLIKVGERSGNLPEMVRSLASLYDEAVRNRTRTMLAIIEPIAILLIGGIIGIVAIAIFLAITSINKVPGL